jgi:outer membrane protein OmpU
MKKVLFATTALVATAGMAAADVTFGGYGRFGAVYTGATDTADSSTDIASRFRLQADVNTETDSGIGFNARMRIQVEENSTNDSNGIRFGVTAGGLAINAGNINGVIESTPNLYMSTNSAGVGLEGNGFHSLATNNANGSWGWTAYSSGGAGATNGVEAIYAANGIRLHAHTTEDDMGVGASYSMSGYSVAVGYERDDNATDDSVLLLTAGGAFGDFNVAMAYADTEVADVSVTKTSIKGFYNVGAATNVYGFVSNEDAGEAFGLGMSQNLGGASFEAGITRTAAEATIASAGVFFSF